MIPSIDGLSTIAEKTPVVATHVGKFDDVSIKQTLARYAREALTYVRPAAIDSFQQRLVDRLLSRSTAIGCIVAPFGYGKTSTAIDTWRICEENGILAVPPFSCSSIAEMGQAIATGVAERLDKPGADRVYAAYEAHLVSSAQRLAEQDAEQYQITFETALRSIEDKIERGYLQVEAMGNHLLIFLEQITSIVLEAGYRGLLAIVDEFQQFLGNINKAVITNFRTLVWGLRTRGEVPFGLLITMDPDTERNLNERAGDIMHRIKEDSLYLDFSDAYDREFSRLLWARYAETLGFVQDSQRIVDYATLDAIGQICERHDLSNGPRTVIDLFQRIANRYVVRGQPYSPIDMIDDFISNEIRFDGDQSKIASLVTELTSYDYIKRVPARLQTLKLIAAFPRGCPREVAARYDLADAYDQLADLLRGEVLTELPEGIALIDLQRIGKPQNKLNIILKKYWMQITEDDIIADRAVRLFTKYALAPIFPPTHSVFAGWTSEEPEFWLTLNGSYAQTYTGTFFEEYPKRTVHLQVCRHLEQVTAPADVFDAQFIFVLHRSDEARITPQYDFATRTFTLGVAINQPFDLPMPRDVRWIGEYLRPVVLSPGVMLSLLDYIATQAPKIDGITEAELARIEAHHQKLNSFLVAAVFGEELFAGLDFGVIARGEQALREVLFRVFRTVYPDYKTLITSPQWEIILKAYSNALKTVSPLYSRGLESLADTKASIAAGFGFRNHAGFDSQVKQFGDLLTLKAWSGDRGEVVFQRHPGENVLLHLITLNSGVSQDLLVDEGRKHGYLPEEVTYLAEFLILRGFVTHDTQQDLYGPAETLSAPELEQMAREITAEIQALRTYMASQSLIDADNQVEQARKQLASDDLTEAQVWLLQAQRLVQQERPALVKELVNVLINIRSELYTRLEALRAALPIASTGLPLDTHINGIARGFDERRAKSATILAHLGERLSDAIGQRPAPQDRHGVMLFMQLVTDLQQAYEQASQNAQELIDFSNQHDAWVRLLERLKQLEDYIQAIASFTHTAGFERDYRAIISDLMELLSTEGRRGYEALYDTYKHRVDILFDEIKLAVKLKEISDSTPTASPPQSVQAASNNDHRNRVLKAARQKKTTLAKVAQTVNISADELLDYLIELEREGKLIIIFRGVD